MESNVIVETKQEASNQSKYKDDEITRFYCLICVGDLMMSVIFFGIVSIGAYIGVKVYLIVSVVIIWFLIWIFVTQIYFGWFRDGKSGNEWLDSSFQIDSK